MKRACQSSNEIQKLPMTVNIEEQRGQQKQIDQTVTPETSHEAERRGLPRQT